MHDELTLLESILTDRRKARLKEVLDQRTRNLVLVLEDIYDAHNASACVRSAEGLGLQELHLVTPRYEFQPAAKVAQGAQKWLDVHHHETVKTCVSALHERGIQVAAGALEPNAVPIQELDFTRPTALVFGNEHEGLSREMIEAADVVFHVPMLGFTQSFNISVATAVALHYAINERIRRLGYTGDLTDDDKAKIYYRWVRLSVPMADELLARHREGTLPE